MTLRVEDNVRSEGIIKIDAEGLLFLHTFFYLIRPKAVIETRSVKNFFYPAGHCPTVRRLPFPSYASHLFTRIYKCLIFL